MVGDDALDRLFDVEISAAEARIICQLQLIRALEEAGCYREALRSRETLAIITEAQDLRRLRQQRMHAMRHITS
jgi:hypothetical protein